MAQSTQPRNDLGASASTATNAASRRPRFRDRTLTFSISLPKAIFGAAFSLFILIWVFIFGIMLGRGHNPEEIVPELASVMPSPAAPKETAAAENVNEVLSSQELQFHDALKEQETPQRPRPAPSAQTAKPQQRREATAPTKPQAKPQPAPDQRKPSARSAPTSTKQQGQPVYKYIYQVAASNNAAAAQRLQKKLQNSGLSVSIVQNEANGVIWHRILVSLTGTPEDTRTLRTKLASHGISAIILRGKTPVQ